MSLTATNVGNNPTTPGIAAEMFVPDQLFAGPFQPVTHTATFLTGQGVIKRGTIVGKVTASGKYIKSLATAADGSQTTLAVAADDVDTSSGDVLGPLYLTGEFNGNAIIYDASWNLTTLHAAGRPFSLFFKTTPGSLSNADPT